MQFRIISGSARGSDTAHNPSKQPGSTTHDMGATSLCSTQLRATVNPPKTQPTGVINGYPKLLMGFHCTLRMVGPGGNSLMVLVDNPPTWIGHCSWRRPPPIPRNPLNVTKIPTVNLIPPRHGIAADRSNGRPWLAPVKPEPKGQATECEGTLKLICRAQFASNKC